MKRAMQENARRVREQEREQERARIAAAPTQVVRRPWHVEGSDVAYETRDAAERALWVAQLSYSARVCIGMLGYTRQTVEVLIGHKYGAAIAAEVLADVDARGPMTREEMAEEVMRAIAEGLKRGADEDPNTNTTPPPVRP